MKLKNINKKIGLGTAQFGLNYGISNKTGKVKEREVFTILDHALKVGINTFDTAFSYGESQTIITKYLKVINKPNFEIITKISTNDIDYKNKWEKNKNNLNTFSLSLLMHNVEDLNNREFIDFFLNRKVHKEVNRLGVSIYTADALEKVLEVFHPDIIQIPINIFNREFYERGILEKLKEYKIEIHARSVFLQGLCFLSDIEIEKQFPHFSKKIISFKNHIKNDGFTLPELSINWVNSLKQIDKIIIGVTNSEELIKSIKYLNENTLKYNFNNILEKFKFNNKKLINPSLW